jgi:hypothetical protein
MPRIPRRALIAPLCTVLVIAGACTFFDPLDQAGLGVILLPADTALYVGSSFTARGRMANSYGDQYPSEHIRYAGLDPSATVGPDGTVTGVSYGRARVVVTRGDFADTGWVSVVPAGTLALSKISEQSTVDIVNADGSGFTSIASSGQFGGGAPAWLPGNAGLVYQFATPGGAGSTQLFVTDLAGNSTSLAASGRDPRVSRDGHWVYFADGGAIWRVHVNGTGLEQVTSGGNPDPSPDSTHLVFVSTTFAAGGFPLEVRDLITGAEDSLGPLGKMPRWRPGGNEIAYWSGDVSSQTGAIFVIGADGTGAYQVSVAGRVYRPQGLDWSPDGQWLLARSDTTLDLIQVATGLTLPLGYSAGYDLASWRW